MQDFGGILMVGAQKPQPKILSKWLNALHRTLTYERNRTHLTHFSRKISVRTNYGLYLPCFPNIVYFAKGFKRRCIIRNWNFDVVKLNTEQAIYLIKELSTNLKLLGAIVPCPVFIYLIDPGSCVTGVTLCQVKKL